MKNYYDFLSKSREEIMAMLKNEYDNKCNAPVREALNKRVKVLINRPINVSLKTIQKAEELGGLKPGEEFTYPNAQGGFSKARVCSLTNLPKDMINPHIWCGGGFMLAPFYAYEILRFYAMQTDELLPFVSTGKEGNKGLFKKLFYRDHGIISKTEYDAYYNIMARMSDRMWLQTNYDQFEDTTTQGNLVELFNFANNRGFKEITFVICTGNPFYDKRLLAEWMYQLKNPQFAEVKINLVLAHCPCFLTFNRISVPEARLTEIFLGYLAASISPLPKDTITFDGETASKNPERYLMPGVENADWEEFRDIIVYFNNMGWNNYQEQIYGIPHDEAVANIILADLFARNSYTADEYDYGIEGHIYRYTSFLGESYNPMKQSFLEYLKSTNPQPFFSATKKEYIPYTD